MNVGVRHALPLYLAKFLVNPCFLWIGCGVVTLDKARLNHYSAKFSKIYLFPVFSTPYPPNHYLTHLPLFDILRVISPRLWLNGQPGNSKIVKDYLKFFNNHLTIHNPTRDGR